MSENTLKRVLNDISIKAQNSLGTFYQKIQPKISHNQLIYQFLRKSKQKNIKKPRFSGIIKHVGH